MSRLLSLLLALALAACATPQPPQDGLPRVYVDGAWLIQGHKHGEPVLRLDACEGCGIAFRQAVDARLVEIQKAAQKARAASVAPVASPDTKEAP